MKDDESAETVWTKSCWWLLVAFFACWPLDWDEVHPSIWFMSFVFFMKISLDLGGEAFHLLSSVAHVFQGTCIAMTIYNIPRQFNIFFCSRHTRPSSRAAAASGRLEPANLCKDWWAHRWGLFFTTWKMIANIMVINDKHWQTYYGIHVCIDNLILSSFTL